MRLSTYSKITANPPLPGFNVEGGSIFTNFAGAYNNGQFFFLVTDNLVYEKPGSDPVQFTFLYWCSDLLLGLHQWQRPNGLC